MKRTSLVFAAAALLAGCQPVPTERPNAPAPTTSATRTVGLPNQVFKFCDLGRAVYVFDGHKQGGIAIVENAPECSAAAS